jgi:hypothetical protein
VRTGSFNDHFNDEALIAYADGEVRYWRRLAIARHLRRCWRCRARLAEFDQQAGRVASLLRKESFLSADRLVEARLRLIARQRIVDARLDAEERLRSASENGLFSRAARIAVSVIIASVVGTAFWMHFTPAPAPAPFPTSPAPSAVDSRPFMAPPLPPLPLFRPPHAHLPERPRLLERPSLASQELRLLWALHRANACTGEPLEIKIEDGAWLAVRGVVRNAARREELAGAILALGLEEVRLELRTVEEAAAEAFGREFAPGETWEFRAGATPFERLAAGNLTRERAVAAAHATVAEAEALLAQAWALRRMQERFPGARLAELDSRERALLRNMADDHLALLRAALGRLHLRAAEALRPFIESRETAPVASAGDWFALVRRGAELAREVFAGGGEDRTDPAAAARELLDLLSGIERDWSTLAARMAAWDQDFVVMGEKP